MKYTPELLKKRRDWLQGGKKFHEYFSAVIAECEGKDLRFVTCQRKQHTGRFISSTVSMILDEEPYHVILCLRNDIKPNTQHRIVQTILGDYHTATGSMLLLDVIANIKTDYFKIACEDTEQFKKLISDESFGKELKGVEIGIHL